MHFALHSMHSYNIAIIKASCGDFCLRQKPRIKISYDRKIRSFTTRKHSSLIINTHSTLRYKHTQPKSEFIKDHPHKQANRWERRPQETDGVLDLHPPRSPPEMHDARSRITKNDRGRCRD